MSPDLVLKYQKSGGQKSTIVVSKAVSQRAVDRNRIKRITKEALRKLGRQEGLVIIVRNNIAHLKTAQVIEELQSLIRKNGH